MKQSKKHTETATVTGLSVHLDCSREQIQRLEKQGIIERLPSGNFDLDASRVRVLRHLRERRPPGEHRNRFEKARAQREELRAQRECHQLVKFTDFQEAIDGVAYVVLKHLSPLPSRLGGRDLAERKRVDAELRLM